MVPQVLLQQEMVCAELRLFTFGVDVLMNFMLCNCLQESCI